MNKNIHIVILAAGKGTRLNSVDHPKVMLEVGHQPMLGYLLDEFAKIKQAEIIVVVGFQGEKVKDFVGRRAKIVWQKTQRGTADAALSAHSILKDQSGTTAIVAGDHPLVRAKTIRQLVAISEEKGALALAVYEGNNHEDFGRVITDNEGHVQKIVEVVNATPAELKVERRNSSVYAVPNQWLWSLLNKISPNPVTGEYYLTDMVQLAIKAGKKVAAVGLTDPNEALGVNTPDQLARVRTVLEKIESN